MAMAFDNYTRSGSGPGNEANIFTPHTTGSQAVPRATSDRNKKVH